MVSTIKFSQFNTAEIGDQSNIPVGLSEGNNAQIPMNVWTTAERPSAPYNGLLGYNVSLNQYEYYNTSISAWVQLTVGGTSGTVTSVNTGTGLTGGPITTTGTISVADQGISNAQIANASGFGLVVQTISNAVTVPFSLTSVTPVSIGLSVSITPSLATSRVLVMAMVNVCIDASDNGFMSLYNGLTPIGVGTGGGSRAACTVGLSNPASPGQMTPVLLMWVDTPETTSAIDYNVRAWTSNGNQSYVNRSITDTDSASFGRAVSIITAMEIK